MSKELDRAYEEVIAAIEQRRQSGKSDPRQILWYLANARSLKADNDTVGLQLMRNDLEAT